MSNLKNTPWILHRVSDTKTYNVLDSKEYFIAEYLDEPTAKAIASLPETLAELEAVKAERDELKAMIEKHQKLQQGMLNTITDREARVKELEENANNLINAIHEGDFMSMALLCETLKQVLEK